MSRIYDALKKAEQDTPSKASDLRVADSVTSATSVLSTVETLPESAQLQPEVTTAAGMTPTGFTSTTVESLPASPPPTPKVEVRIHDSAEPSVLAGCRTVTWDPNTKRMLFFNENHKPALGAEQFRRLRSRLYQIRDKQEFKSILIGSALPGEGKSILIGSALPGEGKSFVAANLAQALAKHGGRRALLIDGDLRKPSLERELGAPSDPGLSEYLAGKADELSILQRGQLEGLFFIPAGKLSGNPAELASSNRFQVLMERMSALFDWIIVDSSPVVPISDAVLMARSCGGVLLVLKAGETRFDAAQKAKEEFRQSTLLGVVLNQTEEPPRYGSYYYNYAQPVSAARP